MCKDSSRVQQSTCAIGERDQEFTCRVLICLRLRALVLDAKRALFDISA